MRTTIVIALLSGVSSVLALSSTLETVTEDFGANPNNVPFQIYVPKPVSAKPAIIVGAHWCTGTGEAYFQGTQYASYADKYGYIVIYPSAPRDSKCWDVNSEASLTHNGGSDSLGIVNMVKWTLKKYNGDASRVFITGTSSGAMLTNLMMGAYPDVFAAGVAWAGVPYGCFGGPNAWNNQCSTGALRKTPQQWGDDVRNAYPGYTGPRPRLLNWHGTLDDALSYDNLAEMNKQWSNVFGISFTKNNTNTPISGYTEMIYGDGTQYRAYSAKDVPHNIPVREVDTLNWFGLTGPDSPTTTTTSKTTTTASRTSTSTSTSRTSSTTSTTTTARRTTTTLSTATRSSTTTTRSTTTTTRGAGTVAKWGQCGGIGYVGAIWCVDGLKCTVLNPYYSQCL